MRWQTQDVGVGSITNTKNSVKSLRIRFREVPFSEKSAISDRYDFETNENIRIEGIHRYLPPRVFRYGTLHILDGSGRP